MPVVNIAPNIRGTQTASFQLTVVPTIPMGSSLDRSSFSLANLFVTGSDDVTIANFALEEGEGTAFVVTVTLPDEVSGSFTVGVTGSVTIDSAAEMLSGEAKTISYDTLSSISGTLGTPEYRSGGVIAIPVTFAFNVIAPSRTIFQFARVSGDSLDGMETYVVGTGAAYELICLMPIDRNGRFSVDVNGSVFKEFSGNHDTVTATGIEVDWNTSEPRLLNYDIPSNYTAGAKFDVVFQFDVPVTFVDPTERFDSADATFLDHFIFEGADLGQANLYRKRDNTYPEFPIPDDLTTDWSSQDMTTEEATIYLMRFPAVNAGATGIFNMLMKEHSVRGPVR